MPDPYIVESANQLFNGVKAERTDEKVMTLGKRFFRWRAIKFAQGNPPIIPTYHLRVEKVGWLKYEVNSYQNLPVRNG